MMTRFKKLNLDEKKQVREIFTNLFPYLFFLGRHDESGLYERNNNQSNIDKRNLLEIENTDFSKLWATKRTNFNLEESNYNCAGATIKVPSFVKNDTIIDMLLHDKHNKELLEWLKCVNANAKLSLVNSRNMFFCSNCNTAHPIEAKVGHVMSSQYCELCYNENESIRVNLSKSNSRGYYD